MARPMPLLAPVTTAIFPWRSLGGAEDAEAAMVASVQEGCVLDCCQWRARFDLSGVYSIRCRGDAHTRQVNTPVEIDGSFKGPLIE